MATVAFDEFSTIVVQHCRMNSLFSRAIVIHLSFQDLPVHPHYQYYVPEYYPAPPYPVYIDQEHDDYYASQIHVRRLVSCLPNTVLDLAIGATALIIYPAWW